MLAATAYAGLDNAADAALDAQCRSIVSSSLTAWDITALEGDSAYDVAVTSPEVAGDRLQWNYCDKVDGNYAQAGKTSWTAVATKAIVGGENLRNADDETIGLRITQGGDECIAATDSADATNYSFVSEITCDADVTGAA